MNVAMVDIQRVIPYARNPRKNELAVAKVAASIKEFGWRQPIVVDSEMVIVVGHTRYLAAMQLGMEKVPVHVAEGLTPEQVKAYRIMDNRSHESSEWDDSLLAIELTELKDADFDMDLTGFDDAELAEKLAAGIVGTAGLTDPDEVPEPPDDAITQPGDLWILGDHRLLCGDSGSVEDVDYLLGGATIHLVNTDPPYNVKVEPRSNNAIAAGNSSFTKTHHQSMDLALHPGKDKPTTKKMRAKDRPLMNDFVSDEAFEKLLRAWFGNITRVLEPGRGFYIWGGYANCGNYPPVLKENKLYFAQAIIWVKEHPVLTRKDFMGNHEWCQPPGTKVLSASGTVPIESLRDGDRVVSFTRRSSAIVGLKHGFPVRKAERDYEGGLYGIVAGRNSTWTTDGHLWNVKLTPDAGSMWCVYLMRRGNWWRVGKSKLLSTWGFGLKSRMFTEGGEHGWILSVHRSSSEAMLAEQFVSIHYGIPTTFWRESPKSRRTEAQIQRLYDKLDLQVLEGNAIRALLDHNRRIEHPFVSNGNTRPKYGRRVPMIVRACNLLSGAMAVPIPAQRERFTWEPIGEVLVHRYKGKVYSLDVEPHHHYIADGIVTHNCFYGWKEGAAHVWLGPTNATDVWSVKKVNPQSMIHLTEKPVELAVRAMQYSSRPGENVLDLFGGSGSTLIAAEQTGRKAFLMEIDPPYADVIVQRWENFTGKKAERVSRGERVAV